MRKLNVYHVTHYTYKDPVRAVVQSLRLRPAMNDSQDVVRWDIKVPGGVFGARFTDSAGDRISTLSVKGPVDSIVITVSGLVETEDTAGVLRGHRERIVPAAYSTPTRSTRPNDAIRALAAETAELGDPLERAHELSQRVSQAVRYQRGETDAKTTAIEAMEAGMGVCQDQAQVLIAAAREARLPARYVSGYLLADEDGQAHDAGHAWAEIHIDTLGWVGFDVANHCCPDDRYIRVGSGADANEAAPIRGSSFGITEHELNVEVSVRETA